ncbi:MULTISPECIES: DUF1801 domain-containing protein [unclassified Jeotgalibaca]|uniref:DUF1801 domain-containing protein n=1 Tax=unclassified Jeotgalibaca TaxID=2621505 RepID=UPI003FD60891
MIETFIQNLSEERKGPFKKIRQTILENLPEGFEEIEANGMLSYVVPHSIYPKGYHTNPDQPLPFISLASQKKHIAVYHMGLYGSPELLKWFEEEYKKQVSTKLDMGKSCIRLSKMEAIPYELLGELCQKMTPQEFVAQYESFIKK